VIVPVSNTNNNTNCEILKLTVALASFISSLIKELGYYNLPFVLLRAMRTVKDGRTWQGSLSVSNECFNSQLYFYKQWNAVRCDMLLSTTKFIAMNFDIITMLLANGPYDIPSR